MDREEILKMEAGREMDALVAEKVMGQTDFSHSGFWWTEWNTESGDGGSGFECPRCGASEDASVSRKCCKPYSVSIAAAWEVVLHFMNDGWCPNLVNDDGGHWALSFEGVNNIAPCTSQTSFIKYPELWCDEAPLAICRAALLAVIE